MKRKPYRILSVFLSAVLLISACGAAFVHVIAAQHNYYVQNGGTGDGRTSDNPAATVADVINTINEDGLSEGDIANVYIMQRSDWASVNSTVDKDQNPVHGLTAWAVDSAMPAAYAVTLVVQPYSTSGVTYLVTGDKYGKADTMHINGPTIIKNLRVISASGYEAIRVNGHNFTFILDNKTMHGYGHFKEWPLKGDSSIQTRQSIATYFGPSGEVANKVNITYDALFGTHAMENVEWCPERMYLGGASTTSDIYKEDVNLTFDLTSSGAPRFVFGNSKSSITFKKNLNINIKSAREFVFEDVSGVVNIEGAYQVIKDISVKYTDLPSRKDGSYTSSHTTTNIENFNKVTIQGGSYILTNESGNKNLLDFTDNTGVYTVSSSKGYAYAYDIAGNSDTLYYGNATLNISQPGHYIVNETADLSTISVKPSKPGFIGWVDNGDGTMKAKYSGDDGEFGEYYEYINYRGSLENTYTKLTKNKKLNVVYFGGSVTNGTGLPEAERDTKSWRGLISNWLTATFPEANIKNVNRAAGESGTFLGAYRLARDVIAENPDLLFVEYSINDFYYGSSYTQASAQFETIVRKVREALPECDIVTILVTDQANAPAARNGRLHIQAQAHEDISIIYGIPTIHVGRALADRVSDAAWSSYMSDNVHPLAAGYEIYYNVIHEFMYNSLKKTEYQGVIKQHTLPELQNEKLLDGNVTVIQASQQLLNRSVELGGSEFFFNAGSTTMWNYNGDIRLNKSETYGTTPEFILEFTGTNLVAYFADAASTNKISVKVDNGEYRDIYLSAHNPTVLADGLPSRKHTVYIRPDMSTFSMRLAIPVFYSRDAAYQTTKVVNYGDVNVDGNIDILDLLNIKKKLYDNTSYCPPADVNADGKMGAEDIIALKSHLLGISLIEWQNPNNIIRNYYVQAGGTGNGKTMETPAGSVVDVINTINNLDNLDEGDIANVYILKGPERATKGIGSIVGRLIENTNIKFMPEHGYTSWVNVTEAQANNNTCDPTPAHTARLVIQGYDHTAENPTYLLFNNRVGANINLSFAGPTEFKNITIVSPRKNYVHIFHNGNDVIYRNTASFGILNFDYNHQFNQNYASDPSLIQPLIWNGVVNSRKSLGINIGYNTANNTASQNIDVTFENDYAADGHNQSIFVQGHNGHSNTFNGDVNITFNNSDATPNVYLGNYNASATTIKGNLNILVKDAKSIAFTDGAGTLNISGALQAVVNSASYTGNILEFEGVTAAKGIWFVNVETDIPGALLLTDKAGVYRVADGYTAIATDANGNEFLSSNGLLTIPAGVYTVQVIDYYANNGSTITVYDEVCIDLANENASFVDGKVFLGWANADGDFVPKVATYKRGDVLTARYASISEDDFKIEDIQVTTNKQLRFIFKQNMAFVNALPQVVEYGAITIPTETAGGREIRLDTPVVIEWQWDTKNVNKFTPKTVGSTPEKIAVTTPFEQTSTERRYECRITGIGNDDYNSFYMARGYIKYLDGNGIERVVYTDSGQSSLYKVAAEEVAKGNSNSTYLEIINHVENTLNVNYRNSLYNGSEILYTDPNDPTHFIRRLSNGLYERNVTINSGFNISQNELCFFTDPHLAYINTYDIETNNVNALSSYRGRSWLRAGDAIRKQIAVSKYVSTFKKAVLGGDAVDYLTWGALEVTKNLISKQSVNNSILMAVGNHEVKDLSQPDDNTLVDISLSEGYRRVSTIWNNDVYYHEEVVNDANGNPNYMVIVLDNSQDKYWESQINPLKASIAKARLLNIPVLVFQHIPMLTMNPEQPTIYLKSGFSEYATFGTKDNYTEAIDSSNYPGWLGDPNSDAVTKEVCRIIRQSYDVIKGVFTGHEHANIYSEIAACDAEGNLMYDSGGKLITIPQYTQYGSHYGGVMKITIK